MPFIWTGLHQQKKLEHAIQNAKKAEKRAIDASIEKTEFISRVSHDLKAPIYHLISLLETADKYIDDLEKVQECHDKMNLTLNHLLELMNDVSDMSDMENEKAAQEKESFDLRELMYSCVMANKPLAEKNGVQIDMQNVDKIVYPHVVGRPHYIKQILNHLLVNAIQYNKESGRVVCSVTEEQHNDTRVNYRVMVSDTGIGMSEELLDHLFLPFSQARKELEGHKTGMGLAIVKGLVDQLGGEISVQSRLGEGTTFTVLLPFERNNMELEENSKLEGSIAGAKILLVEDDELSARIAMSRLSEAGANVTLSENGQAAVQLFSDATDLDYDMILMDISMPVMDGIEAAKKIRAFHREDAAKVPIVAMLSKASEETVQRVMDAGMNAYIKKPLDSNGLLELMTLYERLARRTIRNARKDAIKKHLENLEYQALHDSFTDVMNKNAFFDMADIQLQENPEQLHGMVLFDLDNFKQVNDKLGHDVGDQVILALAEILKNKFRGNDLIGRFGGDEFVVFMKNVKTTQIVQKRAEEVVSEVRENFAKQFAGIDVDVTISAGAVTEINLFSSQEMFKFADIALYKAKQKGKDCYQLYEKEKTAEIS